MLQELSLLEDTINRTVKKVPKTGLLKNNLKGKTQTNLSDLSDRITLKSPSEKDQTMTRCTIQSSINKQKRGSVISNGHISLSSLIHRENDQDLRGEIIIN